LVWLGVRIWLERSAETGTAISVFGRQSRWAIYRQGVLTNVLNPKVALFFLSFLPQFVGASSRHKIAAFLFLGAVFIFNGTIYCLLVAWFAAAVSGRLRGGSSARAIVRRVTGALFVGLGLKLAVSK